MLHQTRVLVIGSLHGKSRYYVCMYVGGAVRNWKRRYFVLDGNTLSYYKNERDQKCKGKVVLSDGRGVRKQQECKVEWPSDAKDGLCFGVATASRTYYIYTTEFDTSTVQ